MFANKKYLPIVSLIFGIEAKWWFPFEPAIYPFCLSDSGYHTEQVKCFMNYEGTSELGCCSPEILPVLGVSPVSRHQLCIWLVYFCLASFSTGICRSDETIAPRMLDLNHIYMSHVRHDTLMSRHHRVTRYRGSLSLSLFVLIANIGTAYRVPHGSSGPQSVACPSGDTRAPRP